MKKLVPFLLLIPIFLYAWLLRPRNFHSITEPYRQELLHSHGDKPDCTAFLSASNNFGNDSVRFEEITSYLSEYTYRLDPRSIIPGIFKPQKQIDICISYYTGCSSGGFLLLDDDLLWISDGAFYRAYRPDHADFLRFSLMSYVDHYGE